MSGEGSQEPSRVREDVFDHVDDVTFGCIRAFGQALDRDLEIACRIADHALLHAAHVGRAMFHEVDFGWSGRLDFALAGGLGSSEVDVVPIPHPGEIDSSLAGLEVVSALGAIQDAIDLGVELVGAGKEALGDHPSLQRSFGVQLDQALRCSGGQQGRAQFLAHAW